MRLLTAVLVIAVIFGVSLLTGALALAANLRAGQCRRQRELLGAHAPLRLALGYSRAFFNSVWSLWFTALALPFGQALGTCSDRRAAGPAALPPVILVHGLYHNPAAWFVMRARLKRAGFNDVRCYGYASFGRPFTDIAGGLAAVMVQTAREAADGRILLMGHSLGGLVIRAALADGRTSEASGVRVAGVVTLGTPHCGSTLAGMLGMGRLARGLAPGGEVLRLLQTLPARPCQALSLYTPTDAMVLPLCGALLGERERQCGWRERALPAMSHVGLLYSGVAAKLAMDFFREGMGKGQADGQATVGQAPVGQAPGG